MFKGIFCAGVLAVFFTGCAYSPVMGTLVTNVTLPKTSTEAANGGKIGKSSCTSILGIVAFGDCSIQAAKADGAIDVVSTVDYELFSVLGIFAKQTTIVRGK